MLLMSVFGTTMTAFALVGSTGKAFSLGIGVYGLMASSSGLIHAACFFLVGIRMWSFGKKYGYMDTDPVFPRPFRVEGSRLFAVPDFGRADYSLSAGWLDRSGDVHRRCDARKFRGRSLMGGAGLADRLGDLLGRPVYVFSGGVRSAVWANTFQTIVFMIMGLVGFIVIAKGIGRAWPRRPN